MFEQLAQQLVVATGTDAITKRISMAGLTGLSVSVTVISGTIVTAGTVVGYLQLSDEDENWLYFRPAGQPSRDAPTGTAQLIALSDADEAPLYLQRSVGASAAGAGQGAIHSQFVRLLFRATGTGTNLILAVSVNATAS